MKKILFKRIILGLSFVFIFLFSFTLNVSAEEVDYNQVCSEALKGISLINRYGLSIERDSSDNMYKVVMKEIGTNDPDFKSAIEKIQFKIVTKNGQPFTGSNNVVSINSPVNGISGEWIDVTDSSTGETKKQMVLVLEFTETSKDPDCTGGVSVTLNVDYSGENQYDTVHFDLPEIDTGAGFYNEQLSTLCLRSEGFTYNGTSGFDSIYNLEYPRFNDTFKATFCAIYDMADLSHKSNQEYKLSCDKDLYVADDAPDSEYYVNKKFYFDSKTTTETQGYYYNHFYPGDETKQSDNEIKCDVTCEEAVSVEYGPPVSSIGGVCFEYKVKVTSYVNCSATKPNPPKGDFGICTPSPTCTSNYRSYYLQGGPDDDFDDCIQQCDGGKYTKKCSNKCYKQVYGNSNSSTKLEADDNSFYNNAVQKLVSDGDFSLDTCKSLQSNNYGCYYRSGNSIKWSATRRNAYAWYTNGGYEIYSAGRWYIENAYAHKNYANYTVSRSDGFYRHNLGGGSYCNDTCWWNSCPYDYYLNYGFAEKDWEDNKTKYENAINACKAKASCSEKTAEITMNVKYNVMKGGKEEERVINFPYTENNAVNKDFISSKGVVEGFNDTSTSDNTTIISKRGCYVSAEQKNNYQVIISFPGSWESRKGEGFEYIPKDTSTHIYHEREFCIPDQAVDVNASWDHYITKKYGEYEDYSITTDEEIKNTCGTCKKLGEDKCISIDKIDVTKAAPDPEVPDNINATVHEFGYFGWDFDISCFYSQSHNKLCIDTKNNDEKCDSCYNNSQYRVRTVDLKNLFPKADGTENDSVTELGRIRGFNWSDYAIISKDLSNANATKDNAYVSVPSNIARKIQDEGYTIYEDDKYLDYEFKLSPSVLKEIKKSAGNYTDYKGQYVNLDGNINVYKSSLFRSGGLLDKSDITIKKPEGDQIYCNNIDSSSKDAGCEKVYN